MADFRSWASLGAPRAGIADPPRIPGVGTFQPPWWRQYIAIGALTESLGGAMPGADTDDNAAIFRIPAKTLSFCDASRVCSIDFGQFVPMFRLDAARYRNAIP